MRSSSMASVAGLSSSNFFLVSQTWKANFFTRGGPKTPTYTFLVPPRLPNISRLPKQPLDSKAISDSSAWFFPPDFTDETFASSCCSIHSVSVLALMPWRRAFSASPACSGENVSLRRGFRHILLFCLMQKVFSTTVSAQAGPPSLRSSLCTSSFSSARTLLDVFVSSNLSSCVPCSTNTHIACIKWPFSDGSVCTSWLSALILTNTVTG
mmetsp:Transcript_104132/g.294496  ORF Transcript_104132/g.294496 Transcript_104132/m.294496 type:complete len:210 (-) Transcript_104132:302-931(-)